MNKLLVLVFVAFSASAQAQNSDLLVTPQWLNDHLKDPGLIVIQVTNLQFEYDNEHISGARYLWPGSLAPDSPYGAFNAPDSKKATEILQNMGISNTSKVVLYYVRNEVSVTARMFLTLEYLGLKGQVYFLNGGLDAWKKAGYTTTNELPVIKKGKFKVNEGNQLVDKNYVLKTMKSSGVIVDARMQRFYDGEPTGNPRDGHIAGAKNIPYPDLLDAANMFKPADQLQAYFTPVVPEKDKEIVTYCFIGQTASVVYMAGRILGYDHIKLYDGSLQEWSRIESLPMEVTKKP